MLDACAGVVDSYVVVEGYEGQQVRSQVGEEYAGHPVDYVTQDEQLGTSHAVEQATEHVDEHFLVLNGDVVVDSALVTELARTTGSAMAVKPVDDPRNYGVVSLDGTTVTNIVEKPADPPTDLANLGIYAFERDAFAHIEATELSERGEYEITESLQRYIDAGGDVTAVEYEGRGSTSGGRGSYSRRTNTCSRTWSATFGEPSNHERRSTDRVVEEGARVQNGAYIEGPVVVQAGADVGPNAYVRGVSVVGPDVGSGTPSK